MCVSRLSERLPRTVNSQLRYCDGAGGGAPSRSTSSRSHGTAVRAAPAREGFKIREKSPTVGTPGHAQKYWSGLCGCAPVRSVEASEEATVTTDLHMALSHLYALPASPPFTCLDIWRNLAGSPAGEGRLPPRRRRR